MLQQIFGCKDRFSFHKRRNFQKIPRFFFLVSPPHSLNATKEREYGYENVVECRGMNTANRYETVMRVRESAAWVRNDWSGDMLSGWVGGGWGFMVVRTDCSVPWLKAEREK
uniref:Uncharacterized protein n=1 Tax=Cacopsylla melanoneura TaxID=428564 RepID=A0A8D8Q8H9_9HEMI